VAIPKKLDNRGIELSRARKLRAQLDAQGRGVFIKASTTQTSRRGKKKFHSRHSSVEWIGISFFAIFSRFCCCKNCWVEREIHTYSLSFLLFSAGHTMRINHCDARRGERGKKRQQADCKKTTTLFLGDNIFHNDPPKNRDQM
jgi:hypothetical protein